MIADEIDEHVPSTVLNLTKK